jgi:hypothetical protein
MRALLIFLVTGLVGCDGPEGYETDAGVVSGDAGFDQCTGLPPGPASLRSCSFNGERCAPGCSPITALVIDERCCESDAVVVIDCVRGATVGARACVIDTRTGRALLANSGPLPLETWPRCPDEILVKLDAEECVGAPE